MVKYTESKKQKVISEKVIVIAIVVSLMAFFLYDFTEQDHKLTNTGLNSTVLAFSSKLNIVRSQWFMDKQPNVVVLREFTHDDKQQQNHQNIPVNKKGWVDISNETNETNEKGTLKLSPCQLIWQYLIGDELKIMNAPVVAIEINDKTEGLNRVCRYQTNGGAYFEYDSANGKITGALAG